MESNDDPGTFGRGEPEVRVGALSAFAHVASGGVDVSGVRYATDFCYTPSGGVEVSGYVSNSGDHQFEGSGVVAVGGSPGLAVPHRVTSTLGGVVVSGHTESFFTDNNHTFYYYASFSYPNLTIGGQSGVATSAPPMYSYAWVGGLEVSGNAADDLTGLPGGRFPFAGSGGVGLAGVADLATSSVPIYAGRGGALVGGGAEGSGAGFAYNAAGSLSVGGFGDAPASVEVLIDMWFLWDVLAQLDVDQEFEWGFGEPVLYWFQVNSCCAPTTCDRFILDDGGQCHEAQMILTVLAPDVEDVCRQLTARGLNARVCEIRQFSRAAFKADQQKLAASGVPQECDNLVDVSFCQLPACMDLCVDHDVLIDVGFSFATALRYEATGGVVVFGSAGYGQVFGGDAAGGAGVGGSAAVASSASSAPAVTGGASAGGAAEVTFFSWNWAATGGAEVGGTSQGLGTQSSRFSYVAGAGAPRASAGFRDGLTALTLTDPFGSLALHRVGDQFIGCRQMTLGADDATNSLVSAPVQFTFYAGPNPSSDARDPQFELVYKLKIGYPTQSPYQGGAHGGLACATYPSWPYRSDVNPPQEVGECLIAGPVQDPVDVRFFYPCFGCYGYGLWSGISYAHAYGVTYPQPSDRGVLVSEGAPPPALLPSGLATAHRAFAFASTGAGGSGPAFAGVALGGLSASSQGAPSFAFAPSGGASTGGLSASVTNHYTFAGSGGASSEGGAAVSLGHWSWTNNEYQGAAVGGSASSGQGVGGLSLSSLAVRDAQADLGGYAAVTYARVEFNGQRDLGDDTSGVPLTATPGRVKTTCDCNSVGTVLAMRHNLAAAGRLGDFLDRNRFSLPPVLVLSYNAVYGAWQSNAHYDGFAPDGSQREAWNLVFEWQCSSFVGGADLGSPVWRFAALVSVRNLQTGEDFDSRVVLLFSRLGPCEQGDIRFVFDLNTSTGAATSDPSHSIYGATMYDGAGLFRSPAWRRRPVLSVVIAETDAPSSATRVAYNPIFPET